VSEGVAGKSAVAVLVAEDNPASRLLARVILERAGFRVSEASNGLEALNAVRDGHFAAVIMDCRMPVMDGYMATRQIRQLAGVAGKIPIIALTASALREDRERAELSGMDDFLSKPFEQQDLVAKCLAWTKVNSGFQLPPANFQRRFQDKPAGDFSAGFLPELLETFLNSAPPSFQRMLAAIQAQDWAEARERSHWLQGGAARVLDPALQIGFQKIEKACRSNSPSISQADLESLQREFELACKTATFWLRNKTASGIA
jgi:CheY-like chemotaxis protein